MEDNTNMTADELRAAIEAELIRHWRTPLPPNPTPAQELKAWENDVKMLNNAYGRALEHRAEADRIRAEADRRVGELRGWI